MVTIKFEARFLASQIDPSWKTASEGRFTCLEVDPGLSTGEIMQSYHLEFSQPMAILINDTTSDLSRILNEGDQVRLLPQIAGGTS